MVNRQIPNEEDIKTAYEPFRKLLPNVRLLTLILLKSLTYKGEDVIGGDLEWFKAYLAQKENQSLQFMHPKEGANFLDG